MRFISRIKSIVLWRSHEVFRRWSRSELEDKKIYLESKPTEEFDVADHYLVAEWVIQRYLPEGGEPTPAQWSKAIGEIRRKIDFNLKKETLGELVNIEDCIPIEPYNLTKEDFINDLIPAFVSFSLLPDPHLKDRQGNELWISLFKFTQSYSCMHGEARDALILFCDAYRVEKLVQDLARTYTSLRRIEAEGLSKITVVCTEKQCSTCMDLDGEKLLVEELLACFKNGKPLFPHMIESEEGGSWCPPPNFSPEIPLAKGDDPEFHAWLVEHLE